MTTPTRVVGFRQQPDKYHTNPVKHDVASPRGHWECVTEPLQVPSVAVPHLEATRCTTADPPTPTSVASSGCRPAGALSTAMHAAPPSPSQAATADLPRAARVAVVRDAFISNNYNDGTSSLGSSSSVSSWGSDGEMGGRVAALVTAALPTTLEGSTCAAGVVVEVVVEAVPTGAANRAAPAAVPAEACLSSTPTHVTVLQAAPTPCTPPHVTVLQAAPTPCTPPPAPPTTRPLALLRPPSAWADSSEDCESLQPHGSSPLHPRYAGLRHDLTTTLPVMDCVSGGAHSVGAGSTTADPAAPRAPCKPQRRVVASPAHPACCPLQPAGALPASNARDLQCLPTPKPLMRRGVAANAPPLPLPPRGSTRVTTRDAESASLVVHDWRRLLGVMCLAGCFACSLMVVGVLTALSAVVAVVAEHARAIRLRVSATLAAARVGLLACLPLWRRAWRT